MNLICKLFGHNLIKVDTLMDDNPVSDEGWKFYKSFDYIYSCSRCGYSHANRVNIGMRLKEGEKQ